MTGIEEKGSGEREFYVYLKGTWQFDHSAWGESPEEVLTRAVEDLSVAHGGEGLLHFSEVEVVDERTQETVLTWTPDEVQPQRD